MECMNRFQMWIYYRCNVRGMMEDVVAHLRTFMENETRSCSMDIGCITPLYV